MDTRQPQSYLLNLFQSKTKAVVAELVILFVSGMFAAAAYHFLKMPMHLPGKQGLLFMVILTSVSTVSSFRFAATFTSMGTLTFFLLFTSLAPDPFKPFLFVLVSFLFDLFLSVWRNKNRSVWFIGIAGSLCWAIIPVVRIFITLTTGAFYESFVFGFVYPILTHLAFGFIAAMVAALSLKKFYK